MRKAVKRFMDSDTYEKLLYLLNFMEDYIDQLVYKVMTDSQTDSHYSAVTATNLIKCYIQVMNQFNKEIPYTDIRGYFKIYLDLWRNIYVSPSMKF